VKLWSKLNWLWTCYVQQQTYIRMLMIFQFYTWVEEFLEQLRKHQLFRDEPIPFALVSCVLTYLGKKDMIL